MARIQKMTLLSTATDMWQSFSLRFNQGMADIPGIGGWFRPHWTIIILRRDGSFISAGIDEEPNLLSDDDLRQLAQKQRICLRLGEGLGQQKLIALPQAASHDPASAIRLSLEQHFPFPAYDTAFTVHGTEQSARSGQCNFRVSFARRSLLDECLERAAAFGIAPKAIDALGQNPVEPVSADLMSGGRAGGGRNASALLLIVCAMLVSVALLLNAWSTFSLAPAAAQFQVNNQPGNTDQALLQKKTKDAAPTTLQIWYAATRALPDNAYAEYLIYEKGQLRLAGKASDAAGLVSAIEAQDIFTGTAFAAASLKEDDGKESFDLTTNVRNEAKP